MTIKNVLAGIAVADLAKAERWYTELIGRVPDSKPMEEVFEYQFPTGGWLQVFSDSGRAGHGSMTMVVEDFEGALTKLDEAGIAHEPPSRGDYVDTVIFADPDGNRIGLCQVTERPEQGSVMRDGTKLQVVRRFAAPPERVWSACTRPELLQQWFSPRPFHDCVVEADVRVGGRFFFRMTGEPGTFAAEGEYREVNEPRRLVLTWKWVEGPPDQQPDGVTSLVTFEIDASGDGTRLTLTHEGLPDQTSADDHEQGWTETFEKLARLLEEGGQL